MRTTTFCWITCSLAALGACNWAAFDDLEKDTWVDSTGKPDVKSDDWGVAIQRGADTSEAVSTGTLTVIGAGPGTYSELKYDATGSSNLESNSLLLGAQGIMTLDSPPILLASPTSAEVALVTSGDTSSIVVATGIHTLQVRQLFVNATSLAGAATIATTPDAATYMQPPAFPDIAAAPGPEPIVAAGDVLMGTVYGLTSPSKQPACKLADGTNMIQVRALGAVPGNPGPYDDVLVWNGVDGRLLRYKGTVFNGCLAASPTVSPTAAVSLANTPAFRPGHGSQILRIDADRVLLQGHQDVTAGNASYLQVYSLTTMAPLGNAVTTEGLRQAAILDTGTAKYVVAGYPTALVDTTAAGKVLLYRISDTAGLETTPSATLRDAQPDDKQSFGRSVAVMPYRGKQVIAVSAGNEVFVYFQVKLEDGSVLYEETRQGK